MEKRSRVLTAEEKHILSNIYNNTVNMFSALAWKNMFMAIASIDDERARHDTFVSLVLQITEVKGNMPRSLMEPQKLLEGASAEFQSKYKKVLETENENGFNLQNADKSFVLQIINERLRACGSAESEKEAVEAWVKHCSVKEKYSGFKHLQIALRKKSPLHNVIYQSLTANPKIAYINQAALDRNQEMHNNAKKMTVADAEALLKIPRKAVELFRFQADAASYQAACRHLEVDIHSLRYAPFPHSVLREKLPYDSDADVRERIDRMVHDRERNDVICFVDLSVVLKNGLLGLNTDDTTDASDAASMRSGRLEYLATALKRELRTEDVGQLLTRCSVIATPRFWLSHEGKTFLDTKCAPFFQAQYGEDETPRMLLMDKQTERLLRAKENDGEAAAKSAGYIRRSLVQHNLLKVLAPIPGMDSPEDSIRELVRLLPEHRFCLLMTGKDFLFAKRLNAEGISNVIPVVIGERGTEYEEKPLIFPLCRDMASRCIEGQIAEVRDDEPPQAAKRNAAVPQMPVREESAAEAQAGTRSERRYLAPSQMPESGDTLYTGSGKPVVLDSKLGEGGEGAVFAVKDSDRAAKIYNLKRNHDDRYQKLCWMAQNNPGIKNLCWPEELLWDDRGAFVGFVMQRVPAGTQPFNVSVGAITKPATLERIMEGWDRYGLARLCASVCETMARFPDGILMGDINMMNFMLDTKDKSFTKFWIVDCDSFQIGQWPCPVGRPEYTSPRIFNELGENPPYDSFLRTKEDEAFVVATLLFRILVGTYPYSAKAQNDIVEAIRVHRFVYPSTDKGKDSTDGSQVPEGGFRKIWANMPRYLKESFEQVFREGIILSISDWAELMRRYASDLEKGYADRIVFPTKFFVRPGKENNFVDFVCDFCKNDTENVGKWVYENSFDRNGKKRRPLLCSKCRAGANYMKGLPFPEGMECQQCGQRCSLTLYDYRLINKGYKKPICPTCSEIVEAACDTPGCAGTAKMARYRYTQLQNEGKKIRCSQCMEMHTLRCEYPGCGQMVGKRLWQLVELRQKNRKILCDEHRGGYRRV